MLQLVGLFLDDSGVFLQPLGLSFYAIGLQNVAGNAENRDRRPELVYKIIDKIFLYLIPKALAVEIEKDNGKGRQSEYEKDAGYDPEINFSEQEIFTVRK